MNRTTSSLLAAVIAAVAWTVISLVTGGDGSTVALWAVVFFVGTFVITYGLSTLIATSKARGRG